MKIEGLHKHGLPPRTWITGGVAVFSVPGLVLFGLSRTNDATASNPNLNAELGMTTGAAPVSPSKRTQ